MRREVSGGLSKLMVLAAVLSLLLAYTFGPIYGLGVAVGMLFLMSVALVSPQGPMVNWDVPGEQLDND